MPSAALPDEITTERLRLRPWRFEDFDDLLSYASDEEWARYLPVPQPYVAAHGLEFIARQVLADRMAHPSWTIVLDGTGIGGINIRFSPATRSAAMGWAIARPLWCRGYATEAARAVIDLAYETRDDLNRIEATADTANAASQRVMEKVGMKREGELRQRRFSRGEFLDIVYFSILRSEWQHRGR